MNYLKNKIKLLPVFRFFLITIAVFLLSACNKSESGVLDFEARFISNIDNKPVFSWSVTGKNNKLNQAGFRIIIAENIDGLENESGKIFDSGEVKESGLFQLKYQGNDLECGKTYFAKIGVWSDGGHPFWSKPIWFTVPINYPEDMFFRSHRHPMQAGFDSWFFSGIAGINPSPDAPGFRKINFKPYLTKHLSHAEADYISAFGKISSSWKKDGDKLTWDIEIPENTKGEVMLPCYGQKFSASVNGKPMDIKPTESDFAFLGELGSGKYHIELTTF